MNSSAGVDYFCFSSRITEFPEIRQNIIELCILSLHVFAHYWLREGHHFLSSYHMFTLCFSFFMFNMSLNKTPITHIAITCHYLGTSAVLNMIIVYWQSLMSNN